MSYAYTYREYAIALYEALREDAFYATMEKTAHGDGREAMLRYLDYSIIEARDFGLLHEADDHDYGVSVWSVPVEEPVAAAKHQRKTEFIREHMGEDCLAAYEAIVAAMSANARRKVAGDAWYLSILGILPAYQGRGFGASLVLPVIDKADAAGVATWLETFTPRNISFYERLGYRAVGSFAEPTTGASYWLMARPCFQNGD